ncbi:hypothetical protein UlMin_001621 [Ulmus minor]
MASKYFSAWRTSSLILQNVEEDEELRTVASMPAIPQPETPKTPQEPMEFLSRSWSLSASEISKALAQKQKQFSVERNPDTVPGAVGLPPIPGKVNKSAKTWRTGSIGKWFQAKESSNVLRKKDKLRLENARVHSALSIAGLAAALAAVASEENSSRLKMSMALASATQLLAQHCIEMAEIAGADHERVTSVVLSAVDIQSPGDLMTLTAAAATGIVYGVCDETAAWPYQKERELSEDVFGLKTAQGLLEFKCKSKFHKQRWVEGLRNLLRRVAIEETEGSLGFLSASNSI